MSNVSTTSVVAPETGRRYPMNGVDYPIRFFNMLHFQRPKTLNEIFKWAIILNESSGLLDRITDTMARYPITPVLTENDIGENKDYWSNLLNNQICIQDELVKNGKDYYTFGNCIVSIVPPFKRYLVCPKCKNYRAHCISEEDRQIDWKFRDFQFYAKCLNKECGAQGIMKVKDEYLEGDDFIKKIKIQRWPIQFIKVRNLSIAGKKKIFYRIEDKYVKPILKGDRFVVSNIPETFLLACKQNPQNPIIELPEDLTFHYEHEGITEPEWEGLSKPFFFSAWKDIFMSFVLRKAQETIASDHLIPNRFIFPTATPSGQDPLSKIDGAAWMGIVTTQLKRQQNDPNEIGVVPFALGYQALGGQGKAMSLREEIELQDRRILTQLGIPPELIYGGMTWSGSNISLRMLENLFLYYINKQNQFIRFFVTYLAKMSRKEAPSNVKLKPFRMADDIQQINLLSALGAQGRISESTALGQVGINIAAEAKQMEDDKPFVERIQAARQIAAVNVNKEVSEKNNINQVDIGIKTQLVQGQETQSAQSSLTDGFIATTTQGFVNKLNTLNYQQRQLELRNLQMQDPETYNKVIAQLNGIQEAQPMAVTNPVKPPRTNKV
jgi:hypothetical protein